jgi:hypothetical protein
VPFVPERTTTSSSEADAVIVNDLVSVAFTAPEVIPTT